MTRKEFLFKFVQISVHLAAEFAKQGNTILSLSVFLRSCPENHMIHFVLGQSFSIFSVPVKGNEKGSSFTEGLFRETEVII